jgi:hypothetical protein
MSSEDKEINSGINLRSRIEKACEGLTYMSETDSDVTPIFGKKVSRLTSEEILSAIGVSANTDVEIASAKEFFTRLTSHKEWFTEKQKKNADGFGALKNILEEELDDLKVYRVGKIQIEIYVLGVDKDKKVAGVRMNAIET